jgi:hypothetical protein
METFLNARKLAKCPKYKDDPNSEKIFEEAAVNRWATNQTLIRHALSG